MPLPLVTMNSNINTACRWAQNVRPNTTGIIAGCSKEQEWLLPWWWEHLRAHDDHPVTFVNFGNMTDTALLWCKERGEVVTLNISDSFIAPKELVNPYLATQWIGMHPQAWQIRLCWHKKPFALLQTPYERTLWLDLDCQVNGSLQPIFDYCQNEVGISMAKEAECSRELNWQRGFLLPGEPVYNSGVIPYRYGAPIIATWAQCSLKQSHLFYGDQQLLTRILFVHNMQFPILPNTYNWLLDMGENTNAVILHYYGIYKRLITEQIEKLHTQDNTS